MAYNAAQLTAFYIAQHSGLAPDAAAMAQINTIAGQSASGALSDAQARAAIINTGDNDTAVAMLSYQFFTGETPTAAGLDYLVDSSNNNDLNDPYYRNFNLENRYINFASNLGILGEGSLAFSTSYGGLSYAQAIDRAYETIIGSAYAVAAGINVAQAKADILARLPYFQALANANFPTGSAVVKDLAIKASIVGYITAEGVKADVGVYANAMNNFSMALLLGVPQFNVDIVATYAAPAGSTSPVGTIIPPGDQGSGTGGSSGGGSAGGGGGTGGGGTGGGGGGGGGGIATVNLGAGPSAFTLGAADQNPYKYTGGGAGALTLNAGTSNANNVVVFGDGAGHKITLGGGNNTITTGSGGDTITVGGGANTIVTGNGANTVTLGAGANKITGGTGIDTLVFGATFTAADTIDAGGGVDVLKVSGVVADAAFGGTKNLETVDLTAGGSSLTIGAVALAAGVLNVTNSGNGGVTVDVSGPAANLTVSGGAGADTFAFGTTLDANDTLAGGGGADVLKVSGTVADAAFTKVTAIPTLATTATSSITLDANANGSGIVTVTSGGGDLALVVGGGYTKNLTVNGGAGNDTIIAGAGNDTLVSGGGTDTLYGGGGSNTITLAAGTQVVAYSSLADDTISGFATGAGGDILSFNAVTAALGDLDTTVAFRTTDKIGTGVLATDEVLVVTGTQATSADISAIDGSVNPAKGVMVVFLNGANGEVWWDSTPGAVGGEFRLAVLTGLNQAAVDGMTASNFSFFV